MGAYRNVTGNPAIPMFLEIVLYCPITMANGNVHNNTNVFHFVQTSIVPAVETLASLQAAFLSALETQLEAALPITYANGKVKARFMDDPTFAYNTPSGDVDGAVTGDRATNFNAVTIQVNTDARGRNFRGSKHFGPIAESQTTLDALNAGAITLWGDVVNGLYNLMAGGLAGASTTWAWIVLSQTLSDLEANPCVFTYAWVNAALLNTTVGTMRRRKERPVPV